MKYFILLFVVFTAPLFSQSNLDTQLSDLCNQIAIEMSEYKKTTIAVIEFSDLDGNVTDLGKFLSEEVITKLFQTKKFKVIERQLLNKIIKEQKLQVSGIVDEASAKKLGKLLGVNAIVSGTIAELSSTVKLNARLIGTETGEIFGAASTEILKDESILGLLGTEPTKIQTIAKQKSGKVVIAGAKYEFKDKVFEFDASGLFVINVVSVQLLSDMKLKVTYLIENKGKQESRNGLRDPKTYAYAVGQDGEKYDFVDLLDYPKVTPPNFPIRFSIIFKSVPETIKKISTVFRFHEGWRDVSVTFNDIELSK